MELVPKNALGFLVVVVPLSPLAMSEALPSPSWKNVVMELPDWFSYPISMTR
jgi:hypothetical protein